MFNKKEREKVNRYLYNETFMCSITFFSFDKVFIFNKLYDYEKNNT